MHHYNDKGYQHKVDKDKSLYRLLRVKWPIYRGRMHSWAVGWVIRQDFAMVMGKGKVFF